MWIECSWCDMILPIYEVDPVSAKYAPMEDWICWECAFDLQRETCEDEAPEDDSGDYDEPWYDGDDDE